MAGELGRYEPAGSADCPVRPCGLRSGERRSTVEPHELAVHRHRASAGSRSGRLTDRTPRPGVARGLRRPRRALRERSSIASRIDSTSLVLGMTTSEMRPRGSFTPAARLLGIIRSCTAPPRTWRRCCTTVSTVDAASGAPPRDRRPVTSAWHCEVRTLPSGTAPRTGSRWLRRLFSDQRNRPAPSPASADHAPARTMRQAVPATETVEVTDGSGAGASARSPYCYIRGRRRASIVGDRRRGRGDGADVAGGGRQPARAARRRRRRQRRSRRPSRCRQRRWRRRRPRHRRRQPARRRPRHRRRPPAPTTTAGPTTTVASTPATPSAVYTANAECDPTIGETTLSWRLTNTGVTPVEIISTSAASAVGTEPGSRLRLGLGDDDPRRSRHRSSRCRRR